MRRSHHPTLFAVHLELLRRLLICKGHVSTGAPVSSEAKGSVCAGDSGGSTLHGKMYFTGWKGKKGSGTARELPLDQRTLPFIPGGELTFGVGVNLKMAATRWTDWASDIGLRNDKGSPEEGYAAGTSNPIGCAGQNIIYH